MTIKPAVRISERKLIVKDRTILTGLPDNVVATSGPVDGVFLGVNFSEEKSRHVVPLGTLTGVRFMACFRFKLWWMAQKMGDQGRDIPLETQFLLVETKHGSHLESDGGNEENQIVYTVFLPLIEGSFRGCLQGNERDELELCLESGDADTKASSFSHSLRQDMLVEILSNLPPKTLMRFKCVSQWLYAPKNPIKSANNSLTTRGLLFKRLVVQHCFTI